MRTLENKFFFRLLLGIAATACLVLGFAGAEADVAALWLGTALSSFFSWIAIFI